VYVQVLLADEPEEAAEVAAGGRTTAAAAAATAAEKPQVGTAPRDACPRQLMAITEITC
jgi:hypothetical protein